MGVLVFFLQALLECVRLRTFGKFGLQQMQVDCHYLQVYLWKFVSDEQLVRVLLEQVVASTIERCVEPALMEQSVSYKLDTALPMVATCEPLKRGLYSEVVQYSLLVHFNTSV